MTSTIDQTDPEIEKIEKIKKKLFKSAMRGQWENVLEIYSENNTVHKAKLTSSGDTALHIAVSDGKEEVVRKLVRYISAQPDGKEVLQIKNEQGSTPLHIAASMGNVAMCECIAKVDPSLVGARNDDNETPFFLAALSGKKDAFLRLHQICGTENGYEYSRRKDGDTILHCAIAGDYFGIFVDGLEPDNQNFQETIKSSDHQSTGPENDLNDQKKQDYPENYRTCLDFLQLFRKVEKKNGVRKDAQNHEKSDVKSTAETKSELATDVENPKAEAGHQLVPANYGTCFEFVKFASKAMLVIFGLGSTGIRKIQEKKQKHTWAVQIMNELLRYTSSYEYDATAGANPVAATISPTVATDTETVPYDAIKFAGESSSEDQKPTALSNTGTSKTNQEDKNKETGDNYNTKQAKEKHSEKVLNATKIGITEIVEKIVELFPVALPDLLATKEKLAEKVKVKRETPVLIAAKNGITEIVEKILELFPVAIHDMNEHKKNIVLLAVENRQPHVYQFLLQKNIMKDSVFRRVDDEGNSALHLAAKLGEHKPWLIPGAALQMQWEIKWHEFVKESMPFHFFQRYNNKGETSREIFTETHKDLVKDGSEWLTSTSESCSVVAALIATVAFASATTVPGGVKQDIGTPTLENQPAFDAFAISSLIALCFSVTALVMFLSILTSRYQEKDFGSDLPKKLLLGLTSLFVSIASMLIAFCAGHFFVLKDKLKYAAFPVYAVTCLPITFFAVAQFPLYFDLIWATFLKVPQRSYKVVPL
ncbi:uncharacterized protein LOC111993465 isoform X2 [Quercus suber]|uniref:uncharacterized protein LOC111993465 isoform X2 n=1 Tax=Quercus suber TaxID=58331 RepID=UPI000D28104D|nr:ankyrin repeat and protein kinase domain-containing protein 1 [Quercus suber]